VRLNDPLRVGEEEAMASVSAKRVKGRR